MKAAPWFAVRRPLPPVRSAALGLLAFALPLGVWALFSYAPFLWHPMVLVEEPGDVDYFAAGMRVDREVFDSENAGG